MASEKKIRKILDEYFNEYFNKEDEENPELMKQQIVKLNDEIEGLRMKKRHEEQDIKHLSKMAEEKREIEFQKKEVELQKEYTEKLNDSLKEFHKKLEERFEEELKNFRGLYKDVIDRLPNIEVALNKNLNEK